MEPPRLTRISQTRSRRPRLTPGLRFLMRLTSRTPRNRTQHRLQASRLRAMSARLPLRHQLPRLKELLSLQRLPSPQRGILVLVSRPVMRELRRLHLRRKLKHQMLNRR